jgi:hypothetical protein
MTLAELRDEIDALMATRPALAMSSVKVTRTDTAGLPKEWRLHGVRTEKCYGSADFVVFEAVKP